MESSSVPEKAILRYHALPCEPKSMILFFTASLTRATLMFLISRYELPAFMASFIAFSPVTHKNFFVSSSDASIFIFIASPLFGVTVIKTQLFS
jgi:hypothetical protein